MGRREGRFVMIRNTNTFVTLALAVCVAFSASAQAQAATRFSLPAQPLSDSLRAVGTQTNTNVLFDPDLVSALTAPALEAHLTRDQALARLLLGTGLTYELLSERTAVVALSGSARDSMYKQMSSRGVGAPVFRAAQATTTTDSASRDASSGDEPGSSGHVTEVLVTAQKRSERLQDVPVPVTAIKADALVGKNQVRLQDYGSKVPGLNVTTDDFGGTPSLIIRGVTTGPYQNPTVSIVVDDVPYGPSSTNVRGEQAPDFDPSDLARVEVLRGPQGTLYGASSLGGLLKFVTVDPSTEQFSGRVQAGMSSLSSADDAGYSVRGAVNIPISETFALRASAFTRQDSGYIDNVETGKNDINESTSSGGRLLSLWRPSDDLSLKLSAMYQKSELDGSSEVHRLPGLGEFQQQSLVGTGFHNREGQAYSATVVAKLGKVDLTSLTGYNISQYSTSYDYTSIIGECCTLPTFGVTGTTLLENARTKKFTQEVRATIPLGQRLDWLVGGFYTRENTPGFQQHILAIDPANGAAVGTWADQLRTDKFIEYAAFTNLTIQITEEFDLQLGGRQSRIEETGSQFQVGPFNALLNLPFSFIYPNADTKDTAFTYLVTPRYKFSPELMVYARLASGYRPGGSNAGTASAAAPPNWQPDKTKNYEIGIKGSFLENKFSYDASAYYIDWQDLPLVLIDGTTGNGYYVNASSAKSQGIELSLESRPLTGLTVSAWVAWNDAVLTEDFPPLDQGGSAFGISGNRLPYATRISGNLSVEQSFPITSALMGFVSGSLNYIGERQGIFTSTPDRQVFPAFAQTDLNFGLEYSSWTANLYVNNVTDRRGLTAGGLGGIRPYAFHYIQPRTAGVFVSKSF